MRLKSVKLHELQTLTRTDPPSSLLSEDKTRSRRGHCSPKSLFHPREREREGEVVNVFKAEYSYENRVID